MFLWSYVQKAFLLSSRRLLGRRGMGCLLGCHCFATPALLVLPHNCSLSSAFLTCTPDQPYFSHFSTIFLSLLPCIFFSQLLTAYFYITLQTDCYSITHPAWPCAFSVAPHQWMTSACVLHIEAHRHTGTQCVLHIEARLTPDGHKGSSVVISSRKYTSGNPATLKWAWVDRQHFAKLSNATLFNLQPMRGR